MKSTVKKLKNLASPELLVADEAYPLAMLRHAPEMSEVIWEVKRALVKGIAPTLVTRSSYILKGEDEIPLAMFKVGDDLLREHIAYRLDHDRFAGVPPTVISTLDHSIWGGKKRGACQLYLEGAIPLVELHESTYPQVHRIAILDLRLINTDRHTSNMLLHEDRVIPIDHEYSLTGYLSKGYFEWTGWEQADLPFSREELGYIAALDPEKDREMVFEGLGESVADRLFVSTLFLKVGAAQGISPGQLGRCMMRSSFEKMLKGLELSKRPNGSPFAAPVESSCRHFLDANL